LVEAVGVRLIEVLAAVLAVFLILHQLRLVEM